MRKQIQFLATLQDFNTQTVPNLLGVLQQVGAKSSSIPSLLSQNWPSFSQNRTLCSRVMPMKSDKNLSKMNDQSALHCSMQTSGIIPCRTRHTFQKRVPMRHSIIPSISKTGSSPWSLSKYSHDKLPVQRRAKHYESINVETPVIFRAKAPPISKKIQKREPLEAKIPVIPRSRTKKPTRLATQDKKDSWLCTAFSTAEEYHLEHLSLDLQSQGQFRPIPMPQDAQDVLLMEVISSDNHASSEPCKIFFFREGSVVFWNVSDITLKKVLRTVSKHEFRQYEVALVTWENEHINFSYGSQRTKLTDDTFILDQDTDSETMTLEKFALSNAMALSVKLGIWETSVDKFTSSLESIPESLKRGHRLKMSRVEVMRKTGELFSLRHQINLSSDLLISPDFYWDRDDLDELYNKTCQFYSIGRRTRVTNEKLNHCSELVELMRTHLSERHSLKLEWMIILLIGVEVVFEVIHYIKRYYEDSDQGTAAVEFRMSNSNKIVSDGRR